MNEDDVGSNPAEPPNFRGRGRKGVCTSLSTKTMTVRVRSVPPILTGRLAETDQRRPEEPKSLVRYQKRPPFQHKGEKTMFAIKSYSGITGIAT